MIYRVNVGRRKAFAPTQRSKNQWHLQVFKDWTSLHEWEQQYLKSISSPTVFLENWAIPGLFFFIFVFSIQFWTKLIVNNIADGCIQTADLWYWKRPLYQLSLSHNHCPPAPTVTLDKTSPPLWIDVLIGSLEIVYYDLNSHGAL